MEPVTWNEKGEVVPLTEELRARQIAEALQDFRSSNHTSPNPQMVDIDTSPKAILLAIWRGLMECLEIMLQLNRWWPGRKERLG